MNIWRLLTLDIIILLPMLYGQDAEQKDWWNLNEKHRKDVLKNYDKNVLPHHPGRNTTLVNIGIYTSSVNIEEGTQTMVLSGTLFMQWMDDRLKYDYKDYGGLDHTSFGPDELWIPDIQNYNSADVTTEFISRTHIMTYPNGLAFWPPNVVFKSICTIDLTYWPYDQHECFLYLGSWTNHGWLIDLEIFNITVEEDFVNQHHWKIIKNDINKHVEHYECCPEPYPYVSIGYVLKRDSPSFTATIAIPALVVALMMLVQFLLPVEHPQRITIGCVAALMVLLMLLRLSAELPPLGTSVPLILRFYGFAFLIVVFSVAISGILIKLSHPQNPVFASPPPAFLKIIFTSPVAYVLCLKDLSSKIGHSYGGGEDGEVITDTKQEDYSHEWLFIATAVDRISMLVFITMYILALFVFIAPVH